MADSYITYTEQSIQSAFKEHYLVPNINANMYGSTTRLSSFCPICWKHTDTIRTKLTF